MFISYFKVVQKYFSSDNKVLKIQSYIQSTKNISLNCNLKVKDYLLQLLFFKINLVIYNKFCKKPRKTVNSKKICWLCKLN